MIKRTGMAWILVAITAVCGQLVNRSSAVAAEKAGRLSGEQGSTSGRDDIQKSATILELDEQYLVDLRSACTRAGFTGAEFSRTLTLITRAKLAGLPHTQMLKKLEEGLAKDVMPERIQTALQEQARTLRTAKEVVDQLIMQGFPARDYTLAVAMVADALEAGAKPANVLQAVREDRDCLDGIPDVRAGFERDSRDK